MIRLPFFGAILLLFTSAHATSYYFSDCASGGAGTQANPYCLDPGPGNNPAGNESFDYLMDGTGPEVAAGDTIYLCAGACDGSGTATYRIKPHPGYDPDECQTKPHWVGFDPEVSGTSTQPITIRPYCSGNNCETVILSGDSNGNNAFDSGVDVARMVSNVDCDSSGESPKGHGYYQWLGDPNNDGIKNLIIEKVDQFAFSLNEDSPGWLMEGMEIRYMYRLFFPCTGDDCNNLKPNDGGGATPKGVGCVNNTTGDSGSAFRIAKSQSTQTMRGNRVHHGCFAALRPLNNCDGYPALSGCTNGQVSMVFENNEIYNMNAIINGHQGRNWIIRGNYGHDNYSGIGVEEQVSNVLIEDNTFACLGKYHVNQKSSGTTCVVQISISDGDNPTSNDGCVDSCTQCSTGLCSHQNGGDSQCHLGCTAKDMRIRRNRIFGVTYDAEPGNGNGALIGGIAFSGHNSAGDLGSTVIENNMIWHVQARWSCRTDEPYGGFANDFRETPLGVHSSDRVIIQNNTVYDSGCWSLIAGGGPHTMRNNILDKSQKYGDVEDTAELVLLTDATGSTIENNVIYNRGGSTTVYKVCNSSNSCSTTLTCSQIAGGLGTGNKCAAPSYVSTAGARDTWNLHLSSSDTVCKDFGTTGATNDIDKQSRSGAVDIGADEILANDTMKPRAPTGLRSQ